ncbi:MAG: magnesium transporter CorA family protein [Chloroflexi bacterium]|nr:magnesium transporter CorA family protein [Chloroflexota bacterium]
MRVLKERGITWVNIESPTRREMDWLKSQYDYFHPLDLEDCLSRAQMPKLDHYENYLFMVMHFPIFNHQARVTRPAEVDIFVGTDFVVTSHNATLKPLVQLFNVSEQNEEMRLDIMRRSGGYLLYRILDVLVDYCSPILNKVIENVDSIETRVFDERSRALVREISIVRRDIIAARRVIHPQIDVLESLESGRFPFLNVDPDVYFGDLADHMRRTWAELEELKEVMEGLSDAYNSLTTHQTNQVLRILTFISTIMMPPTLIASIYGMNVALPLEDTPFAFALTVGLMSALTGGMIVFLWRRHWV